VAETAKPKKRRIVKKAETVREKTEKSALPKPDKKTGVIRLALRYIAVPFKLIGKPFAKLGRFLAPSHLANAPRNLAADLCGYSVLHHLRCADRHRRLWPRQSI
jgi:hypothetical protein